MRSRVISRKFTVFLFAYIVNLRLCSLNVWQMYFLIFSMGVLLSAATDEEKNIIIKAKKSILFNGNTAWCKRETKSLFDVTMGSFDGAETCELL